ncbi:MAG: hypothetical protein CSA09_03300 [Candidatus Contendobacter odensis]|uniref:Uncharacterized protein n=1 Tax=Candidatus Contendibacter odensensis TaxID=1400860 RepID=A0A2G6PEW6_9GAMM|nr:MAG: hypothetical protein CSA09_03300 [Candidatus Contendobacter odensis]
MVGTSLLRPDLSGLPDADHYAKWLQRQPATDQSYLNQKVVQTLATAFAQRDELKIAEILVQLPGPTRLCSAEINSTTDLIARGYCQEHSTLCFCRPDTTEGPQVAQIIQHYYKLRNYRLNCTALPIFKTKILGVSVPEDCVNVRGCRTHYWNPDLHCASLFRPHPRADPGCWASKYAPRNSQL